MLDNASHRVWHGGVVRAPDYASHGLYRPEIAAWIAEPGMLVVACLAHPGDGAAALGLALCEVLDQGRWPRPDRVTVETPDLADALSKSCPLRVVHQKHWNFEAVLGDNLHRIDGLGHEQGYVDHGVTPELARALFVACDDAHARFPMAMDTPLLAAVSLPEVAADPVVVWVGHEPVTVGRGLRFFCSLDAYRDHMHVHLLTDRVFVESDDQSLLGLTQRYDHELNPRQRRDIERYGLPMRNPRLAAAVVATDEDGIPRPYGDVDVRKVILLTRAICSAVGVGAERRRVEVELLGETHLATVWPSHPHATPEDLALTL